MLSKFILVLIVVLIVPILFTIPAHAAQPTQAEQAEKNHEIVELWRRMRESRPCILQMQPDGTIRPVPPALAPPLTSAAARSTSATVLVTWTGKVLEVTPWEFKLSDKMRTKMRKRGQLEAERKWSRAKAPLWYNVLDEAMYQKMLQLRR